MSLLSFDLLVFDLESAASAGNTHTHNTFPSILGWLELVIPELGPHTVQTYSPSILSVICNMVSYLSTAYMLTEVSCRHSSRLEWSAAARHVYIITACLLQDRSLEALLSFSLTVSTLVVPENWHSFRHVFTALHCMQRGLSDHQAVCPSVRPSHAWMWQNERSSADIITPYERKIHVVFRTQRMVGGGRPFYLKFWVNRYSLVPPQPFHLAKKSSIITNRKSTRSFLMSLRRTAYVAPQPAKGAHERKLTVFSSKSVLLSKKVCCKVYLCENFQRQCCKAFTGLRNRVQMVRGGCPILPEILDQSAAPLQKRRFPIYIRSVSYTHLTLPTIYSV